jgi:phosphatidylserine/phosphatidylglycerophosphate/cardiolipin synthase-like enzyme
LLIAIPAYRLSCNVVIDKGRGWSVVEEAILWAASQAPRSVSDLVLDSGLKRQIIVAALSRLMRFRLVELSITHAGATFVASAYGKEAIVGGRPLPFFPKKESKRVSFVVEQATGSFFPQGQVRIVSRSALDAENDPDIRTVTVEGGGPSMSHEANLARLSQIAARGYEEQLANVDGRTASLRSEFMVVRVIDGVIRNWPETASKTLRELVERIAALPVGSTTVPVGYSGAPEDLERAPTAHQIDFRPEDLVIGGDVQKELLFSLLASASSRMIVHSTFLDHRRFRELLPQIREACLRGVTFDLLWGAETLGDEEESKNAVSAVEIARLVREDREIAKRFRIHMRSTGSHAKLLLADREDGSWTAAVGSCNWFSSPFRAVEVTVVLRARRVVADVAVALQRMVGRKGLSDDIATEMAFVSRELCRVPQEQGNATATIIVGDHHNVMMRTGSGSANKKMFAGSHRLGSTARPGFIIQAEAARERSESLEITLLYTMPSGPLKNRHARKLAEEAATNGVRLVRLNDVPLHGKFFAWDDDDIAVTSLNWGSASTQSDYPQADVGVHIHSPGIATNLVRRVEEIFPSVRPDR